MIELPALTAKSRRLLVLLHGAGSSPGALVPAALAWQLKLRSAQVLLPAAPFRTTVGRHFWTDPSVYPVSPDAISAAAVTLAEQIRTARHTAGLRVDDVAIIAFSQGASVALELAFDADPLAATTICYAARLYRLPGSDDRANGKIHLLHGSLDSVVPAVYGETAYRRLRAIGADVSLELMPEEGHVVGQMQINHGTRLAMDWVFGRRPERGDEAVH